MKDTSLLFIGFIVVLFISGCASRLNTFGKRNKALFSPGKYEFKHINLYFNSDTLDVLSWKKNKNHFIHVDNYMLNFINSDSLMIYTFSFGLNKDTTLRDVRFSYKGHTDSVYNDILSGSIFSFWQDVKFKLTHNEVIIRSDKPKTWGTKKKPKAMEWIISRVPMEKKIQP